MFNKFGWLRRSIPLSLWLWTGAWIVALAFLLPALKRYGESNAMDHRVDGLLITLLVLSYPVSAMAGAFVAITGPVAGVFANRAAGADFVLTLLWWFGAGYIQWSLLLRLIHGNNRCFRRTRH